jgi:hypothetical protein
MRSSNFFLLALSSLAFVILLLTPSVGPILHPDSSGYLEFYKVRSSFYPIFLDISDFLGLDIKKILILQILVFSVSLYFLLKSMLTVFNKKVYLFIFVMILVGNIWFTSLHKAILTESLYLSLNFAAIAALITFFISGSTRYILIFSFFIGLSIGVRPSGAFMFILMPIIIYAAKNRFKEFNWHWIVALVIPIIAMQILESSLYRYYHGDSERESILTVVSFGKSAMIEKDFEFDGPHREILKSYSNDMDLEFKEVRSFVEKIPYFWLKNQSLSNYELYAQFNLLRHKRDYYAKKANVSKDYLMMELAKQRLSQDIIQWFKLGVSHYVGSWGLRVTTFPYFVDDYNDWSNRQLNIPLNKDIPHLPLKGNLESSTTSVFAFPGLLFSGIVSGLISLVFLGLLLTGREMPLLFILSGIFSTMVHASLLFSSFVNIATPRYTTTQFPILLLAFSCFVVWLLIAMQKKSSKD